MYTWKIQDGGRRHRNVNLEHVEVVKQSKYPQFKMTAAACLNFKIRLPFLYYLTNLHQT